jgi:N-acyl-D-amino-acid deacylase
MTGLPAARFGLDQANQPRGLLREGFAADLVLLNPQTINERASYDEPTKPASGIEAVFINGQLASNVGGVQNAHLGQALAPPA